MGTEWLRTWLTGQRVENKWGTKEEMRFFTMLEFPESVCPNQSLKPTLGSELMPLAIGISIRTYAGTKQWPALGWAGLPGSASLSPVFLLSCPLTALPSLVGVGVWRGPQHPPCCTKWPAPHGPHFLWAGGRLVDQGLRFTVRESVILDSHFTWNLDRENVYKPVHSMFNLRVSQLGSENNQRGSD